MRVLFLTGSGLSADSGLPTFRGVGGLYHGIPAEEFLSAANYARDPDSIEGWLDHLRLAVATASPNAAHVALADYQRQHADSLLFTQNVDTLLERAGASHVVHLHGRLDRLRCIGHAHIVALGDEARAAVSARCTRCGSRLRSDVVLFGEQAPAYRTLYSVIRRSTSLDALVVIGTRGNVLPVNDFVRAFPGLRILNNLHASETISSELFTHVIQQSAADAVGEVIQHLEDWRAASGSPRRSV